MDRHCTVCSKHGVESNMVLVSNHTWAHKACFPEMCKPSKHDFKFGRLEIDWFGSVSRQWIWHRKIDGRIQYEFGGLRIWWAGKRVYKKVFDGTKIGN